VNHLGFQVDSDEELEALHASPEAADRALVAGKGAHCCHARSDKYWITDPAGIAWEWSHMLESIPTYDAAINDSVRVPSACCAPKAWPTTAQSIEGADCCS